MVGDFVFLSFVYDLTILIGVLTLLDAAANNLSQLITHLDLEGTPMTLSPGRGPIIPRASWQESPTGKSRTLHASDGSISSLRPYATREASIAPQQMLGRQIAPWPTTLCDASPPSMRTSTSSTDGIFKRLHRRMMTLTPEPEPAPVFHPCLRPLRIRLPLSVGRQEEWLESEGFYTSDEDFDVSEDEHERVEARIVLSHKIRSQSLKKSKKNQSRLPRSAGLDPSRIVERVGGLAGKRKYNDMDVGMEDGKGADVNAEGWRDIDREEGEGTFRHATFLIALPAGIRNTGHKDDLYTPVSHAVPVLDWEDLPQAAPWGQVHIWFWLTLFISSIAYLTLFPPGARTHQPPCIHWLLNPHPSFTSFQICL
ncbi:hypothetical protein DFH08DRAFT_993751 [Mycena albidolilacea]|uniref:Uncharacterized protein n=1 Tax=Mycena albidolilacea TaxID=1033008 RepID=A0AAD7E723_9AGAR|nr:hypothetical protein DFH08DRAFT_993751 [Mycena albidolilacea]